MRPFAVAAVLACTAVVAPVAAQFAVTGTVTSGELSLAGSVVNSVTGEPVRLALVELASSGRSKTAVFKNMLTDMSGHFRFTGLPESEFRLSASKPGYDWSRLSEMYLTLDRSREDAVIRLAPFGIVRGKVTDSSGEPLPGVSVQVVRSTLREGRRQPQLATWTRTDDRGEYRIPHLASGLYAVRAAGREGLAVYLMDRVPVAALHESFTPAYFGGGSTAGLATLIPLQPGQEFRANFTLPLLPARRIRGIVKNLVAYRGAQIELLTADDDASAARAALNIHTGQFEIQELVDGTYRIRVTQDDGERRLRALQTVQVAGKDIDGLVLTLTPGAQIAGSMRVEGPGQQEAFGRPVLVSTDELPVSNARPREITASMLPEGRFQFDAVPPGRYRFEPRIGGSNMYVASATLQDQDLLATPEIKVGVAAPGEIEIVVRSDGGSVSARAPDGPGRSGILVPESGDRPPMIAGVYEGSLTFYAVPPGTYRVSAWKNGQDLEYRQPDVLQMLRARGERVEVHPGRSTEVEIQAVLELPE